MNICATNTESRERSRVEKILEFVEGEECSRECDVYLLFIYVFVCCVFDTYRLVVIRWETSKISP